ncbi:MAG TPA: L-2-hydroxyglutarate oxidase, partial [Steroidobacteraceae bacterium]|nr:L-2-hydroxyglutarate oxidase [Steroidobacteraceae bacterium]
EVTAKGGEILTGRELRRIAKRGDRLILDTPAGPLETRYLITCGGLYSDRLAQMTGGTAAPRIVPFRGDYYVLVPARRTLVRGLIYPVPDPALPFLGVHLTKRIDGAVWCGPNAVLAFAREGYGKLRINLKDDWQTLSYGGFWRMARRWWRTGFEELYRDFNKGSFVRALQRYVPELRSEDVIPGPAGVRAQALSDSGDLVDDFIVAEAGNAIHVRNAPSPAATSSLAIGRLIVERAEKAFALTPSRTMGSGQ